MFFFFPGSMALMDAGIPLREHVAGVSVGLVSEVDPSTGMIKDYQILTDILVRNLSVLLSYVLLSAELLWFFFRSEYNGRGE